MRKLKDLTGQKFGMLTVIGRGEDYVSPATGKKRPRWLCRCECGNTTLCQAATLRNGKAKSCGCLRRKLAAERIKTNNPRSLDISNTRYGRLVAKHFVRVDDKRGNIWLCECDCGNAIETDVRSLRSGNTKSCGCLRNDSVSQINLKHGKSHNSRLYNVWIGMRQRCSDIHHKSYPNYGGRGITVCKEWNDYSAFEKWAITNGYDESAPYGECTIDRINVNGNYEPDNCRWVNSQTQAHNKRTFKQ